MEAIKFIILQIFFAMHTGLKIGEYSWFFLSFSWGMFGVVTCLDQLRMSENTRWIIKGHGEYMNKNTLFGFNFKDVRAQKLPTHRFF